MPWVRNLDQHLSGSGDQPMNLPLHPGVDHFKRSSAVGAWQARRGTEQSTDQRALVVYRAALGAQMHAIEARQGGVLFGHGLARQTSHFLR